MCTRMMDNCSTTIAESEFTSNKYKIIMYCEILLAIMLAISVASKLATKK